MTTTRARRDQRDHDTPVDSPAPGTRPAVAPTTTSTGTGRGHTREPSRIGSTWAGLAAFSVVLVLLIVFILENGQQARISYFGASGHLPLGIMILVGALAGVALTLLIGSLRIAQLKARDRRHRRVATTTN